MARPWTWTPDEASMGGKRRARRGPTQRRRVRGGIARLARFTCAYKVGWSWAMTMVFPLPIPWLGPLRSPLRDKTCNPGSRHSTPDTQTQNGICQGSLSRSRVRVTHVCTYVPGRDSEPDANVKPPLSVRPLAPTFHAYYVAVFVDSVPVQDLFSLTASSSSSSLLCFLYPAPSGRCTVCPGTTALAILQT